MRVLLASARLSRLNRLKQRLAASGHDVQAARTGGQVWHALLARGREIVVLDGCESSGSFEPWRLLEELSVADHIPLIVLVRAGRNLDRMRAFRAGAVCLTMPATGGELCACLDALAARRRDQAAAREDTDEFYADSYLQIDLANRQLRRSGRLMSLTGREYPVMRHLLHHAGQMMPARELAQAAWGAAAWPGKRGLLKTYVLQLRRKIEPDAHRPRYLVSRRGLGYGFMPQQIHSAKDKR